MSRTEIWRNAARIATEQQRQRIRSTAEAQRRLAEQIELIAESLKLLSDENQRTQSELREQFQATADLARQQIKRAQHAADRIENEARLLTWETRLLWLVSGLLIGVLSLTALAIWQPKLLQATWMAAQALGTVPVQ